MTEGKGPLFVERRAYRRRRLRDAARVLPVVGAMLFLVPLLWMGGGETAGGGIYLFVIWALLIVAAAAISRPLSRDEPDGAEHERPK